VSLGFLMCSPVGLLAQDDRFAFDAVIDVYYSYDSTRPPNRTRPFATEPARHNEFNVGFALARGTYSAERVRASLGLTTGTYADANYAAEPQLLKNIFEAFAGVRLADRAWLDAGVLPSHIGFESAITSANATYSRSLIAEFSPYYVTGARVTFEAGERLTAAVLVVNGWQNIRETNDAKAAGVQIQYRPTESLLLNYSNYIGDEAQDGDDRRLRIFHDLYAQAALSESASITVAFDVGTQEGSEGQQDMTWYGGAVVAAFAVAPRLSLGVRGERYSDPDQAIVSTGTADGLEAWGASVNLDYHAADPVLLRLEGRLQDADAAVFPGRDGLETRNVLVTAALAFTH
jgi:hypothetical protein